jgi:D-xylose transport system substrate-binding protein
VDFYVTQNSFDVGVLQAKAALAFLKKNKASKKNFTFIILRGQAGQSVAAEITRGVHSILDKKKSVRIFSEKTHAAWSPTLAMATVEKALASTGNKIDAVLANNSGMAQGAIEALGEQGLTGKVFVAGADADLAAIKSIVNGRQQFEVLKDIGPLARTAAQVAFALAKGQKPKPDSTLTAGAFKIPTMATPVYPITMEDLEERIFKPGFHTKDSVFGF